MGKGDLLAVLTNRLAKGSREDMPAVGGDQYMMEQFGGNGDPAPAGVDPFAEADHPMGDPIDAILSRMWGNPENVIADKDTPNAVFPEASPFQRVGAAVDTEYQNSFLNELQMWLAQKAGLPPMDPRVERETVNQADPAEVPNSDYFTNQSRDFLDDFAAESRQDAGGYKARRTPANPNDLGMEEIINRIMQHGTI